MQGQAQGTYYSILYYDEAQRDFTQQIDSLLDDFDLTASLWVENSLLRKVNSNTDSVINDLFADLLAKSLQINQFTEGAFDCSVGKLVRAWGFGFEAGKDLTDFQIDSLRQYVGGEFQVYENNGTTYLHKPSRETEIDFNAIAQGYSVDMVGKFLASKGISNYLIDIGGEVIAHGSKSEGKPWCVGIEKPAAEKYEGRVVETVISLKDQSVVTSGNYRKYYEKDGVRYSHTIDPSTGRPVTHNLLSVSVIAKEAWYADAMATAFMVMGLERSLHFLESHPEIAGAYFIYSEGAEYKTFATEGFKQLLNK